MLPIQCSYWWVNQSQEFDAQFDGGFLWSPKINVNGAKNHFYDNMKKIAPGDIIFSFKKGYIVGVAIATNNAYTSEKPIEFKSKVGQDWSQKGWKIDADYSLIPTPFKPKIQINELISLLPDKYAPLKADGDANQAYLFSISYQLAETLVSLMEAGSLSFIVNAKLNSGEIRQDKIEEEKVNGYETINPTQKEQLITARLGQGKFRRNVEQIENGCRITRTTTRNFLIASHIKPWRVSSSAERLDGNNGLLLAPHIDLLFDKGYISFHDDGRAIISQNLSQRDLSNWGLTSLNAGEFNKKQKVYMQYHRSHVFDKFT
jgi:putative restriction endonuclease